MKQNQMNDYLAGLKRIAENLVPDMALQIMMKTLAEDIGCSLGKL